MKPLILILAFMLSNCGLIKSKSSQKGADEPATITSNAGDASDGSSVRIPAGTNVGSVEIQEGADMLDLGLEEELDIGSVTYAGPSVNISSDQAIDSETAGKLVISIPFDDDEVGLLNESLSDKVAILYLVEVDGETIVGVIPATEITRNGGFVAFSGKGWGNYQTVLLEDAIEEEVSTKSSTPIQTKEEEENESITPTAATGFSISSSKQLTRHLMYTITVNCGSATDYLIDEYGNSDPHPNSSSWINCSSGSFTSQSFTLAAGLNHLKAWFRSETSVVSGSDEFKIYQGEYLVFTDPNPANTNYFGGGTEGGPTLLADELTNGNFVIATPNDDAAGANAGAVYLFTRVGELIATIKGDQAGDKLGSSGVTALPNGNFVIASKEFDNGGTGDVGSIKLVNGTNGSVITTIFGDDPNDLYGNNGVVPLGNNNFVIVSSQDTDGGVSSGGSVTLVNGSTGSIIGTPIRGDDILDQMGGNGVTALSNNNYVIASAGDDEGLSNNGSVTLVNGSDGSIIGTPLIGDLGSDALGSEGVTALPNGNYVIVSPFDDAGVADAGSVMLVDGSNGSQIGTTISGDQNGDKLGEDGIGVLSNSDFIIASGADDNGGMANNGSIIYVDGSSGTQVGGTVFGANPGYFFSNGGIAVLPNNNIAVASPSVTSGPSGVGMVKLVDSSGLTTIGSPIFGDDTSDFFGLGGVVALTNNNYVFASHLDDNSLSDRGSIILVNGSDGTQIGSTYYGDQATDNIGSHGIVALENGNFVVSSADDNNGGVSDAGSVILFDGSTGNVIGNPIRGDDATDNFGYGSRKIPGNITLVKGPMPISGGHALFLNIYDDNNGFTDNGSVYLLIND